MENKSQDTRNKIQTSSKSQAPDGLVLCTCSGSSLAFAPCCPRRAGVPILQGTRCYRCSCPRRWKLQQVFSWNFMEFLRSRPSSRDHSEAAEGPPGATHPPTLRRHSKLPWGDADSGPQLPAKENEDCGKIEKSIPEPTPVPGEQHHCRSGRNDLPCFRSHDCRCIQPNCIQSDPTREREERHAWLAAHPGSGGPRQVP